MLNKYKYKKVVVEDVFVHAKYFGSQETKEAHIKFNSCLFFLWSFLQKIKPCSRTFLERFDNIHHHMLMTIEL